MRFSAWFWRLFLVYAGLLVVFALVIGGLALRGDSRGAIGIFTLLWLAVGGTLTWLLVARITEPLARLSRTMQELGAGDDGKPVTPTQGSETEILSQAVGEIRRKLSQHGGQIQTNASRLQAVLETMREGVLAVGVDKSILLANDAGRELLDFATADPLGRPLLEVTRARPVYEAVIDAFEHEDSIEREFESPGKQRRTLALRASRLPGTPCPGVMVVLRDVTELRRLENLRRELVANVSHELKTPLAAIKAYAETLRMGAVNDPDNNLIFVARIEEQAERLHQLILDILQIARVESGQETFDIGDVPMREVFEDLAVQFADSATAKRIEFSIEPVGEDLFIRGDEEGVRAILSNLVDNAIKYTPEAGRVTVRAIPGNAFVTLEVQDTGIGIAEKDQARVFERFYRADKARSRELGGTGLGLSIVKHLAQAFGGAVGLESQLQQGSTFRVTLPKVT